VQCRYAAYRCACAAGAKLPDLLGTLVNWVPAAPAQPARLRRESGGDRRAYAFYIRPDKTLSDVKSRSRHAMPTIDQSSNRSRRQWALVAGVTLVAMTAGTGARGDVRTINLIGEQAAAEDATASIILSRFGGDADRPNSALIFDRKAMPAALADGLPSPLASASADALGARGVSPYDFFADVIDVTLYANAGAFAPVFTASRNGRFPLTDFLWASNAFFESSGDVASRLSLPFFGAAGQTTLTRPTPTLSGAPSSARPSPSGAGVWDEWSCLWRQPLSDPWKQTPSGPC
jgi:hypothetical protein